MPEILSSKPGGLISLVDPQGIPALLNIYDFNTRYNTRALALIKSVGHGESVNAQIMTTLQNSVYIYTTGDKVGSLTISGIAFAFRCIGETADTGAVHGIKDIYNYYNEYKISSKKRQYVNVTLGGASILGILMGINVTNVNEQYNSLEFSLQLITIPEESDVYALVYELPYIPVVPTESTKVVSTAEKATDPLAGATVPGGSTTTYGSSLPGGDTVDETLAGQGNTPTYDPNAAMYDPKTSSYYDPEAAMYDTGGGHNGYDCVNVDEPENIDVTLDLYWKEWQDAGLDIVGVPPPPG